jgi:hypothetical protein
MKQINKPENQAERDCDHSQSQCQLLLRLGRLHHFGNLNLEFSIEVTLDSSRVLGYGHLKLSRNGL